MNDRSERALAILQQLAAEFIRENANTNPLITVIRADASPDFRHATIFVTVYPSEREDDAIIYLTRTGTEFREYIKKHGSFMRIPFFDFKIDYGERHRQHLDEVAKKIEEEEK